MRRICPAHTFYANYCRKQFFKGFDIGNEVLTMFVSKDLVTLKPSVCASSSSVYNRFFFHFFWRVIPKWPKSHFTKITTNAAASHYFSETFNAGISYFWYFLNLWELL